MIIDYKRHIDVNKVAQVQDSSLRVYSCLWVRRFSQMAIQMENYYNKIIITGNPNYWNDS